MLCGALPVTADLAAGDLPTDGEDVILGTNDDDVILAGAGDDIICGQGGNDSIFGDGGDDALFGNRGDDSLDGGAGSDELDGSFENDALRGDRSTFVAGAPSDFSASLKTGAAYIFTQTDDTWTETQTLESALDQRGDHFGESVAIEGDTIFAGAPYGFVSEGNESQRNNLADGAVFIFDRTGDTWSETQSFSITAESHEALGMSVDLDGDTAVVGSGDFRGDGSAYLYTRTDGTWAQQTRFRATDSTRGAEMGRSVAIDGDTIFAGAPNDDNNDTGSGAAFVFGTDALNQTVACHGSPVTVDLAAGELPTDEDDVILGTDGPDVIEAGKGSDIICAFGGDDTIDAGNGQDLIFAGDGDDTISAGGGSDIVHAQGGDDVVTGGSHHDIIMGGAGNDDLRGGAGQDELRGGHGNDKLRGGQAKDTLFGANGKDTLIGGKGPDKLEGGRGLDASDGGQGVDLCEALFDDRDEETTSCEFDDFFEFADFIYDVG